MKNKKENTIKNLYRTFFSSRFLLVYKNNAGKIKTYEISKPELDHSFGNKNEHRNNAGFRAFCFGRKEFRSFRHDRIVSLTKS
jgi:hypothetical protein